MRKSARLGARTMAMLACAVAMGTVIGCSSASSPGTSTTSTSAATGSKPGYCADRANLQNAMKGLTSLNASSSVSALKSQVNAIQSAATAVVNSAKSDFPNETSAIKSSVDTLKGSVQNLSSNPSAAQIVTITKDAAAVLASVETFMVATSGKC